MKVTRTVWAGGKDGDHFRSLTYLHEGCGAVAYFLAYK